MEYEIFISGNLLSALDVLDAQVKKGLRVAVEQTAKDCYDQIGETTEAYGWRAPNTTGNLWDSCGYLTMGGGKYNITNHNATRSVKQIYGDAALPPVPTNPFSASVFCLAYYGPYLEFGTVRMSAKPFFFMSIAKGAEKMEGNAIIALTAAGVLENK